MLASISIDHLKASAFTLAAFQHRRPQLTRNGAGFAGSIGGKCGLLFASQVELLFEWRAVGTGVQSLGNYQITQRPDVEPIIAGAILLSGDGAPLSWGEQSGTLAALLDGLEWQPLVREALLRAYPDEREF